MEASIVVGLQFGDEGKGRTTDYLCSLFPKESSIVVRFSGGQQAGHTVMFDGKKHVHSNFGSGTLRGVPSYFSEHCCIYLNTIDTEKSILRDKGVVEPKLTIHPLAKLTTPYDVAYNRVLETVNQHGSCGLGVSATMKRHNETPYKLYAIDLKYPQLLLEKLKNIKDYYYRACLSYRLDQFINEYSKYENIFFELINNYKELFNIEDYSHLIFEYENIIFEGSQGIMLDMDHGLFPNVTYANTTSKNAIEICRKIGIDDIQLYYITRCYQTRHGKGWMSNNTPIKLINNSEEINKFNDWQKEFKISELDYNILNYALSIDEVYSSTFEGGLARNLVITCLDQRPEFEFDFTKLNTKFKKIEKVSSPSL